MIDGERDNRDTGPNSGVPPKRRIRMPLSFDDSDVEKEFLREYRNDAVQVSRWGVLVALVLMLAFMWQDAEISPIGYLATEIRIYLVVPLCILTWYVGGRPCARPHIEVLTSAFILIYTGLLVALSLVFEPGFYGLSGPVAGGNFIMVVLATFTLSYLRLMWALFVGMGVMAIYWISAYLWTKVEFGDFLAGHYGNAVMAFVLGAVTSAMFEVLRRRQFKISRRLKEEKERYEQLLHTYEDLIGQLQQQTEAALKAQCVAEEANTAKSKFLAAASHDLRQPMHALTLFSGAMVNEKQPAELQSLSRHIVRSVEALEMLFNALLDISKLDAGVTQPEVTDFPVEQVFANLRNDFVQLATNKRLRLHVRASTAMVRTDPQLLEQILRNLLANAVRYTETGGVVVACRKREGGWRIDVVDTGIGIPEAEHCRIFEEFYQIGNQERDRTKGLGLGLAIVRRLAELLGLSISLRSRVGRGTVFSLTVPAGTARPQVRADTFTIGDSFDSLRVLIVDDEPDVRLALTLLLRGWGCDVLAAESHVEAVAAMESIQWQPEFAIVDFRLRAGKTGIAVLDWLRDHVGASLPGIIITGDIAADRLQEVKSSGYRVLHKPVSPAKLRALLRGIPG